MPHTMLIATQQMKKIVFKLDFLLTFRPAECRLLQTGARAPAPSELSDETYRKNYHLIH